MDPKLVEYVTKLTYKKCGYKYKDYSDDIIQNVLLIVYQEKIDDLLLINHYVVYYLNKEKRNSIKNISLTYKHDSIEETLFFDSQKLKDLYLLFKVENKFKQEHLDLFYQIKFQKKKYKELNLKNDNIASVAVSRIFKAFQKYLIKKKIKLVDFYE